LVYFSFLILIEPTGTAREKENGRDRHKHLDRDLSRHQKITRGHGKSGKKGNLYLREIKKKIDPFPE
jgi:hypothetical protein